MAIVDQFLVSRLIELIRLNKCVYDPRQEHHNNRAVINSVWKCIASEMGQPETLCREKWINLRSNFARELRKTRRKMNEDGGKPANNSSQWIHFDSMMFLAPFVKTRLATADAPSGIEEMHIKVERDPIAVDSPPFYQQDDSDAASFEFFKKRKHSEDDIDDDKMFLLSLLPKMKQLPVLDNMSFRIDVHTLLLSKLQSCMAQAEENARNLANFRGVWSGSPNHSSISQDDHEKENRGNGNGDDNDDDGEDNNETEGEESSTSRVPSNSSMALRRNT